MAGEDFIPKFVILCFTIITIMTLIITRSACEDGNNSGCLVKTFRDVDGKVVWERSCCSEASCQEKVIIIIIIIAIVIGVVIIPLRDLASNCLIPA